MFPLPLLIKTSLDVLSAASIQTHYVGVQTVPGTLHLVKIRDKIIVVWKTSNASRDFLYVDDATFINKIEMEAL